CQIKNASELGALGGIHFRWMVFLLVAGCSLTARAGMTVYDLNDVYRLRLQDISFFAVALLACALGLKLFWNYLAKDFSFLPRIRLVQSLCLSILFGLMMLL